MIKKKLRLKKWVKVVLTIMVLALDYVIYSHINNWGAMAVDSNLWLCITVLAWLWLAFWKFIVLINIWR